MTAPSQEMVNERCIASVIRTAQLLGHVRSGYVHYLVAMMVPVQLDRAMSLLTVETLGEAA